MRNEHNIDELFQEVIGNAEFTPSDKVWDSIDKKLAAQNPVNAPRKVNAGMLAGVAALSIIAIAVVTYKNISEPGQTKTVAVSQPQTTVTTEKFTPPVIKEETTTQTTTEANTKPISTTTTVKKNDPPQTKTIEEPTGLTDRQEAMKSHTISSITDKEKEKVGSDKNIIMLPYYSSAPNNSVQENKQADNSPPVKTEITDATVKNEIKDPVMYVPNAFTPNGDGLNDVFIPQTADNLKEYKLLIYDRNGVLIFQSEDITKGWDGRTRGDEMSQENIYMWKIELKNSKGEREHMMGYLNLLK